MFEYLMPSWWNCLGRMRRHVLVGGIPLGMGFEVLKVHAIPS